METLLIQLFLSLTLTFLGYCTTSTYIDSDSYPPLQFSREHYCLNDGPVSFRNRNGTSIPNCLPAPGPVNRRKIIKINLNIDKPYRCPGKSYVCGYSTVPVDKLGNVLVKCCEARGVTYNKKECVRYFREENPLHCSQTKSGFFLVGATPILLPNKKIGFHNTECPFMRVKF